MAIVATIIIVPDRDPTSWSVATIRMLIDSRTANTSNKTAWNIRSKVPIFLPLS